MTGPLMRQVEATGIPIQRQVSRHRELPDKGVTAQREGLCSLPPTTFDGEPAHGSPGYLKLASITDEGLVSLYYALTEGRARNTAAFLLVGHTLPCRHVEAVDIGKKVARACGVDPSVPGNWSHGSCWHSTPGRKARRYVNEGNQKHPKARYDSNAPTIHSGEYMLHCAQHGTYRRADCVQTCEQGLITYDVTTSPPVYRGGRWFYESVCDAYSTPHESTLTAEPPPSTTQDLVVDPLLNAGNSAERMAQDHESMVWAIQFLSARKCAFELSEIQELSEYPHGAALLSMLESNAELIKLVSSGDDDWFIHRTILLRWLISINLRLSRIGLTQLTEQEWRRTLRSIRLEGQWNSSPPPVVAFGSSYCLVYDSQTTGGVVFPVAAVLSCIADHGFGSDNLQELLASSSSPQMQHESLDVEVDRFLSSHFAGRTVDIVKRREGLHEEHAQTLAEVATHFRLSRERVRQLEATFWKAITIQTDGRRQKNEIESRRLKKELARIFLTDFVRQRGQLVWQRTDTGFAARMFMAKCLGITTWSSSDTHVVVAGPASRALPDVLLRKHLQTTDLHLRTDLQAVSREIVSARLCGLIDRDVASFAVMVAARRRARQTKVDRVYLTLRDIGRPAHFSEVTKRYNAMFPEDESPERNIHAALNRYEHGIVWVGRKGTFALSEWGFRQPQKGLYETVTEIVTTEYTRSKKPVPLSTIIARLGDSRDSIHPTSLVFITEANPDLRYVLEDAFVPKTLTDEEAFLECSQPREATSGSQYAEALEDLRISSLAGLGFTGKHQRRLVELGKKFSISTLNILLRSGVGPTELAQIFDTKGKVLRAENAIHRLQSTRELWTSKRRHDPRATWLLPPNLLSASFSESDVLGILDRAIATCLGRLPMSEVEKLDFACKEIEARILTQARRGLDGVEEVVSLSTDLSSARETLRKADWRLNFYESNLWLPFLSLELIHRMKSMRSSDRGLIQRLLIRANREIGLSDEVMPWAPEFPEHLAALPVHWLYQFAPQRRLLQTLDVLSSAYCTNIGHLVAFHPTAWNTVRDVGSDSWTKLAITLSYQE